MVKASLTPAHPHSLEALLDEPLTRTLDHPTPNRQSQSLVLRIVDMLPMPLQVRIQRSQSIPCRVRQALDRQGLDKVCQDPVWLAMPQPMPCPAKPPTRLGGAAVQPGRRSLPPVGWAAPQPMPPPPKPPPRGGGAAVQPGRRSLPQVLRGVVKVQDAH